jgi:hypothetical protein
VKQVVLFALAALLAGCAGHVEWLEGLSGEEHRAYTRSDNSCDDRTRSRDPVCYNPRCEEPQHQSSFARTQPDLAQAQLPKPNPKATPARAQTRAYFGANGDPATKLGRSVA